MFDQLAARGPLLIVVDQPNTIGIGALPVTVARACGHDVAYLPGLSMRRIADLYPGQAKTPPLSAWPDAAAASSTPCSKPNNPTEIRWSQHRGDATMT